MTSKWVRVVAAQRQYTVDWRFISLRFVNQGVDYAAQFPPEYEAAHIAGLKLLRLAARTRADHGREAVARLYAAIGDKLWDDEHAWMDPASLPFVEPVLVAAGLRSELASAHDAESFAPQLRAETEEALALTGKDVRTPDRAARAMTTPRGSGTTSSDSPNLPDSRS